MSDAEKLWAIDPTLAAAFNRIKPTFEVSFPGSHLRVAQGFRTPSMQASASSSGHSPFDGQTAWSKHQAYPALALDFAVIGSDGKYVANGTEWRYVWTGHQFEAAGFTWGGRWRHPDYDHVERGDAHAPKTETEALTALAAYQAALNARPKTV